ncbi:MAG: hypothetical protein U0797_31850 [Gemmataceae bacterium]
MALLHGRRLRRDLARHPPGFYARAVGAGPEAARAAGLPVTATVVGFVLLSGACWPASPAVSSSPGPSTA